MKKPNNNGIETKYDGLRNITYEQLKTAMSILITT